MCNIHINGGTCELIHMKYKKSRDMTHLKTKPITLQNIYYITETYKIQ